MFSASSAFEDLDLDQQARAEIAPCGPISFLYVEVAPLARSPSEESVYFLRSPRIAFQTMALDPFRILVPIVANYGTEPEALFLS
jgi:hypothetical protein